MEAINLLVSNMPTDALVATYNNMAGEFSGSSDDSTAVSNQSSIAASLILSELESRNVKLQPNGMQIQVVA